MKMSKFHSRCRQRINPRQKKTPASKKNINASIYNDDRAICTIINYKMVRNFPLSFARPWLAEVAFPCEYPRVTRPFLEIELTAYVSYQSIRDSNVRNDALLWGVGYEIYTKQNSYLRNECLFFWVHGVWIVARDKQIAWTAKRFSCDLFVPRYDLFPMNPEKKTLIPYIYNASNKDLF